MIKDCYFWITADLNLHKSPEVRFIPHRAPQKHLTCPQHMWMLILSNETQWQTGRRGKNSLFEGSGFCFTARAGLQQSWNHLLSLKFFMVWPGNFLCLSSPVIIEGWSTSLPSQATGRCDPCVTFDQCFKCLFSIQIALPCPVCYLCL